jgi:Golgi nucleoside diphosphatase
MAGNFFDDFFSVMPFFIFCIGVAFSSLAISLYPNLTIPAIIVNLAFGIYYLVKGYNFKEERLDDHAKSGSYKLLGWVLTLSAISLGIKFFFLGYKMIPIFGNLLLGRKNLNNKTSTV